MAASRARSADDSESSAAARAATGSGCSIFSLLVQAVVQAEDGVSASPLLLSLASGRPLLDTLGVTGSSPVAPTYTSPWLNATYAYLSKVGSAARSRLSGTNTGIFGGHAPMPRTKNGSLPSYRLYRRTGQAIVTIDGRDHYLGPYGSLESKKKYRRLIDAWLARQEHDPGTQPPTSSPPLSTTPTANEVILAYLRHASDYYKPTTEGEQKEVGCIRDALRIVRQLAGRTPAVEFGPKALKAVRQEMVKRGWSRGYVNHQVNRIRRMFRWATEEELIPATVFHALQAVRGLRKGLPGVRESKKVRPVSVRTIKKVLKRVRPMVRAMILFQFHTGCRPGEVCRLRPNRIDRSGAVWVYRPRRHKAAHHGKSREIFIGPRAQKVLRPWLEDLSPDEYVFSPVRAEALRQAERRLNRKTPLWPSHVRRQDAKRKADPRRRKRERYDAASYRRAVKRACKAAKVSPWAPNRLRHTAATRIRKRYGIELARIILGHSMAFTTEIYAEADRVKAVEVIGKIG
jgi:integrase